MESGCYVVRLRGTADGKPGFVGTPFVVHQADGETRDFRSGDVATPGENWQLFGPIPDLRPDWLAEEAEAAAQDAPSEPDDDDGT